MGIVGGERDIRLTIEEGSLQIVSANVGAGVYTVTTTNAGRGIASLVYDGPDGDAFNIDPNGLDHDMSANGAAALRLEYSVDVETAVTVNLFSGSSSPCGAYSFAIEGTGVANEVQQENPCRSWFRFSYSSC